MEWRETPQGPGLGKTQPLVTPGTPPTTGSTLPVALTHNSPVTDQTFFLICSHTQLLSPRATHARVRLRN